MKDLIERQAAIDLWDKYHYTIAVDAMRYDAELRRLPSAQPQRAKGKWKRTYLDHEAMGERPSILYCSECGQCIAYTTNYCPNCGAKMQEE